MKKSYQKRIDNLSRRLCEENAVLNNTAALDNVMHEELPEIEGLDEILELPQPLREISLVKAICDGHKNRKRKKAKAISSEGGLSKVPELAAWQESSKDQFYNSQN